MSRAASFVHLHVHSPYSFLDGASPVADLVAAAAGWGMPALAITDRLNLSAVVELQRGAKASGLKPIAGAEVTVQPPGASAGFPLVLLAQGPRGYANLCRLVTQAHRSLAGASWSDLEECQDGLIALSGNRSGEIPSLLLRRDSAAAAAAAQRYRSLFGWRFYLELQGTCLPGDARLNRALIDLGERCRIPLVATGDVRYATKQRFPIYDLQTCIRSGTRLDEVSPARPFNSEQHLAGPDEMAARLRPALGAQKAARALQTSLEIAASCAEPLQNTGRRFPHFPLPAGYGSDGAHRAYLRRLVLEGAERRYGRLTPKVLERLEQELNVIAHHGYEEYFLLVWDLVEHARRRHIRYAGRGSAAGSAVAYCLGITEVDAIGQDLLFERFMSQVRAADIDIDFDARYRDEIAQYVYDKYGHEHVAAVCTYQTFHARGAVREAGKALGLPAADVDAIARRLPYYFSRDPRRALEEAPELRAIGLPPQKVETLLQLSEGLIGLPRHIGTHLGGLVITREPLTEVTPLQRSAKGVIISQFDKRLIEDLGLVKLDLLSLRTLGAVQDAVEMAGLDYDAIPLDDPDTYRMLNEAETVGVFQLESPAQRALQSRLQAGRLEDIVAATALIRPGPIQGNMVEPFLRRKLGLEPVTYPHPATEPILAKTYGVIVYQEQVIEIARAIAGFTAEEADRLRRVMSHARSRGEMERIGQTFIAKARARGVTPDVAQQVFEAIVGYASYGFCEAHARAFAVTAAKTAYLLRHHPAEYYAALLNHQPMGYYSPNTLVNEARRRGIAILPLDINRSAADWTVETVADSGALGAALRVGLNQVRGLPASLPAAIEAARAARPFAGLADFCRRVPAADRRAISALIRAGAFDRLHPDRRGLLWSAEAICREARAPQLPFFPDCAPRPPAGPGVHGGDGDFLAEWQILGIMTDGHIMRRWRDQLEQRSFVTADGAKKLRAGEAVQIAGWLIRPHRPPTRSGRRIVFFALEDETGMIDVTLFEAGYKKYGPLLFGSSNGLLAVRGRIERRGQGVSITAEQVQPLPNPWRSAGRAARPPATDRPSPGTPPDPPGAGRK